MARVYKRENPKKKRRFVIAFFVFIMFAVFGVAVFAGFLGSNFMFHKSLEDPDVVLNIMISGGDIVVTTHGGRRIIELFTLVLEIEGVPLSDTVSRMPAPSEGKGEVRYSGVCNGVTGVRKVAVRGIFADGSSSLLKVYSISFT